VAHAQLHQLARRVVNEHQQGAAGRATFEPRVFRTVDLNQFSAARPSQARPVNCAQARTARCPQSVLDHPLSKRLDGHGDPVKLAEFFPRKRRSEVSIAIADQQQCSSTKLVW
jgi:hypothetical protein